MKTLITPEFDKTSAELYLKTLDPKAKTFCFYAFHPNKTSPPKVFEHRKLPHVWKSLCAFNLDGYGIYVCVNTIPKGKTRRKETISDVNAIWQEDDDKWKGTLPIKPHMVVETSLGKYHRYILTKKTKVINGVVEDFRATMSCMVQKYGSDKNVVDISRVLRLPGLYNTKGKCSDKRVGKKGGWYLVRIQKLKKNNKRVPWKSITKSFPEEFLIDANVPRSGMYDSSRLEKMLNIKSATSYYEDMLGYSMSLANRGHSEDEIVAILEALLVQGKESRPNQNMKIWRQRMNQVAKFAESATKKAREQSKEESSIDPSMFMNIAAPGWDFIKKDVGDLIYAYTPKYMQLPSITMVNAVTGLGKTFFNLSMGMSLATGADFLKWSCNKKKGIRVLYVDGEMPEKTINNNMRTLTASFVGKKAGQIEVSRFAEKLNKNFRLINIDMLPNKIFPDLTELAGQQALDVFINHFKPDLVYFDNITTIFKTAEDDQRSWQPVQDWIASMRAKNISVVLVHHDNKDGVSQRGFSNKQDIIDYAIHLKKPPGYSESMGARFIVHFTKKRDLYGDGTKAFEARLEGATVNKDGEFELDPDGVSTWQWSEHSVTAMERIVDLIKDGNGYAEICKELAITKGAITYNVKKALKAGLITDGEVNQVKIKRQPRRSGF